MIPKSLNPPKPLIWYVFPSEPLNEGSLAHAKLSPSNVLIPGAVYFSSSPESAFPSGSLTSSESLTVHVPLMNAPTLPVICVSDEALTVAGLLAIFISSFNATRPSGEA